MTNIISIQPVGICNKSYDKLVIQGITTNTTPTGRTTRVSFGLVQGAAMSNQGANFQSVPGYKDTLLLENPTSVEFDEVAALVISTIGVTVV